MPAGAKVIINEGELREEVRYFNAFSGYNAGLMKSALTAVGNDLRGYLKAKIPSGPPLAPWPQLHPHTGVFALMRKQLKAGVPVADRLGNHKESKERRPLMKFKGLIRYSHQIRSSSLQRLIVGFIDLPRKSLYALIHFQTEGFSTQVSMKSRRFLEHGGFPLRRSTRKLIAPSRALIDPVRKEKEDSIVGSIKEKYFTKMAKALGLA